MKTASGGVTARATHDESERTGRSETDGQIVVVRAQVIENIGHVIGNLFQRVYHLIDRTREADASAAEQLHTGARRLETFLQLVIDYMSPLSLSMQYIAAPEVAQSLARGLSDTVGGSVKVDVKASLDGRLLVDPGRLARGFDLLAAQLQPNPRAGEGIELKALMHPAGRSLNLAVLIPPGFVSARTSEQEVQWAVAEKLIEIHGGALQQSSKPSGGILWEITLPLQP